MEAILRADTIGSTSEYAFYDCSAQRPKGRASLCYDREALDSSKAFKTKNSALDRAAAMGIELLTEGQYQELQGLAYNGLVQSWPEIIRLAPETGKSAAAIEQELGL